MKRTLRRFGGAAGAFGATVRGVVTLVRATRRLRLADLIVVMDEGGFGHTIIGPDAMRRAYPGRRLVFIALSEHGRHNRRVARLWREVSVIFLPLNAGFRRGPSRVASDVVPWFKKAASRFVLEWCRWLARRDAHVFPLVEFYEQLPVAAHVRRAAQRRQTNVAWWNIAYLRLSRDIPAAAVYLPGPTRHRIAAVLKSRAPSLEKTCCLYLRQKGSGQAEITSSRRCGSPLEAYVPGIRLLVDAGYQVLATGDVILPASLVAEFHGAVVDARSAGIDADLFSIYAGTEASISVGDVGGGTWLPGLNGIPRLVINTFPYFYGFPGAWMYYKDLRDAHGRSVEPARLFREYAYDWDGAGMQVVDNSAEEIAAAISSFLQDLRDGARADGEGDGFPDDTWIHHAGARLSPAWIRRHEQPAVTEVREQHA